MKAIPDPAPLSLSVKVLLRDSAGRILLLQRAKTSKSNLGKWEFPGGKIDPGEDFVAALLREVYKETRLQIRVEHAFGTCQSKLPDRYVVYLVMEGTAQSDKVHLSAEHQKFRWVAPENIDQVDFSPQFRRLARRYAQDVKANPRVKPAPKPEPKAQDLFKNSVVTPESLTRDLALFQNTSAALDELSDYLESVLTERMDATFPMAQIECRVKGPVSFAGKLIKKDKYQKPLEQVTDLVGARVVLHLQSEVDAVCRWIEETFEWDRANSVDKLKELGADKFGYRSVHYVVVMRADKPAHKPVPRPLAGLKAEIQVRTIAQHAWSDIGHDRVYKSDCDVPDYWKREANRIAALLEAADDAFAQLVKGVATYRDHMKHTASREQAERQIQLWDVVRRQLPVEVEPVLRVAHLALARENWARVCQVVDEYQGPGGPPPALLCAKGYALCKRAAHTHAPEWKEGINILLEAAQQGDGNLEPNLRLGQLLAAEYREQALEHFKQAFEKDPSNPQALVGYIRCRVLEDKNTKFIPLLRQNIEDAMRSYARLLAQAFADYRGTIISGGTEQGISGLVGQLTKASRGRIRAVGYLPGSLPADQTATRDERYDEYGEIRLTDGTEGFSAQQPIQNWLDLLAAGIKPTQVRVLGNNGGNIAGLEYRLAIALGAQVGVIEGSGREAERIMKDWPAQPPGQLLALPPDAATLRAFLHLGKGQPGELLPTAIENAAKLTHQDFLEQERYRHPDPVMRPWPDLREDFRASNLDQIEYLVSILHSAGFGVRPITGSPSDPGFTAKEIQQMGEMEHGRWNVERLGAGWSHAKTKDTVKKQSPYILPWDTLKKDYPQGLGGIFCQWFQR